MTTAPAPPATPATPRQRQGWRLTTLGVLLWAGGFGSYVALAGVPTSRGLVVGWAVAALLASRLGDLPDAARSVVVDFGPLFGGLALYDLLRGQTDDLSASAHVEPHLSADRVLFLGTTPTERLQEWLYQPGPPAWYDYAAWALHLSHFFVATTLLVVLWRLGSPRFRPLLIGVVVVSYAALATYWLYPAVPPWMASDSGHLGEVVRVVHGVWREAGLDRAPTALLTRPGDGTAGESVFSNPVAALPSLHAALPVLLLLALRGVHRWLTGLLAGYAVLMGLALVYGAEHYVFDVVMGWGYAWAAWQVTSRRVPQRAWAALRRVAATPPRPSGDASRRLAARPAPGGPE